MEDNMDLRILDRLDAEAKRDVLRTEQFQLGPPSDWDDLDDATTNSSIEIETVGKVMGQLDNGPVRFENLPPGSENFEKKWS